MNTKNVSIGLFLVSVAMQCASLTIGTARGSAWIGRPLELSIPVVHDTLSDATALCAHAEVYYAETRQDASRVYIQQEPTDRADTVRLRLRSSTPIDEPVVSVNLRVGCDDKSMRRFVLLADFPTTVEIPSERDLPEVATAPATPSDTEPVVARAPSVGIAREETSAGATEVPARKAQAASAAPPVRRPATTNRSASARATVAKAKRSAPAVKSTEPQRARLQLESVDILLERIKTLEAAATAPPVAPVSQDSERLQRLENDLQNLREQTARNGATLLTLQKQLERAETQRVSTEWFYGLVAMLMLSAVAIVMLWQRRRVPQTWDESSSAEPDSEPEPYEAQFLRKASTAEQFTPPPPPMPVVKAKTEVIPIPEPGPEPDPQSESEPELTLIDLPVDVNLVEFDEPQWSGANNIPARRP